MLKVRLNCPICSIPIGAKSLEGHLENVHKLTGTITLRLNPTHPYTHEPEKIEPVAPAEAEARAKEEAEAEARAKEEAEAEARAKEE